MIKLIITVSDKLKFHKYDKKSNSNILPKNSKGTVFLKVRNIDL